MAKKFTTIDEYIAEFPQDIQGVLQEIRQVIREAAPGATEAISYGLPTFKLNGNLVHFGSFKTHIGFYPASEAIEVFSEELAAYDTSRGTIRFPLSEPVPLDLISRIVLYRVAQNQKKK